MKTKFLHRYNLKKVHFGSVPILKSCPLRFQPKILPDHFIMGKRPVLSEKCLSGKRLVGKTSHQGNDQSGKQPVGETSCRGNVFLGNVLSGKHPIKEMTRRGNDPLGKRTGGERLSGKRPIRETSCPRALLPNTARIFPQSAKYPQPQFPYNWSFSSIQMLYFGFYSSQKKIQELDATLPFRRSVQDVIPAHSCDTFHSVQFHSSVYCRLQLLYCHFLIMGITLKI